MPDIRELRASLPAFAVAIGWPLEAWQARALGLEHRTTVLVAPRQAGKSRSLAVLALHRAFREAEQRVLIVSAGEEAARRLLAEVRRMAAGPLLAGSVVDEQAGLVRLSNGSEVRSVPASERQVRGWSVDLLLIDEAALVPDDLMLGAAIPTTAARPQARIVMASSPLTAAGAFYDHAMRGEGGSEHVRTFRWALADAHWISPSVIAAARESMSEQRFAAEYEGAFATGADALFSRAVLERQTADFAIAPLEALAGPARLLGGTDWGATTDRSALVAIGRMAGTGVFAVVCAKRWAAGHPLAGPDSVVEQIAGSAAHWDTFAPEANGLGAPLSQELAYSLQRRAPEAGGGRRQRRSVLVDERELQRLVAQEPMEHERLAAAAAPVGWRTRLRPIHTTAALKAAAYSSLRVLLDRGLLVLPASAEDLLRELALLRVDLTPTGVEHIEASTGHDDLADALMLAAIPYRRQGDPRWRTYLGTLAERLPVLPAPLVAQPAGGELVRTGGGVELPRLPVLQSVRGSEVTVPPGLRVGHAQDAWLTDLRARLGRATATTTTHEEITTHDRR